MTDITVFVERTGSGEAMKVAGQNVEEVENGCQRESSHVAGQVEQGGRWNSRQMSADMRAARQVPNPGPPGSASASGQYYCQRYEC